MANMMTDSANEQPNYLVEKMSQLNFMSGGRRFVAFLIMYLTHVFIVPQMMKLQVMLVKLFRISSPF